ncbi:MAG: tRNA (guanosine(37)-N1)-methyltransferase TrmD [Pseudomonadota bacterium]|nr:tRNA (guanosine(37)-N1)-methyltransferase TrmD [Pseudomonadota bacterium]
MRVWKATVLTLFPEMFPGPLGHSLAGSALTEGKWQLDAQDIRQGGTDRRRTVDAAPFGGGPGMVMRPDVVDAALNTVSADGRPEIHLSPRGRRLDQDLVWELAKGSGVVLFCGRYEGLDERVIEARGMLEVSLGDYVLSGGESAAMTLIDACVRLLPGVLGASESLVEESFQGGLLEYPQYTRPANWRGMKVPEVLVSGHHERIQRWRHTQALKTTRERRVDLWSRYVAGINEVRVSS